MGQWVVFEAGRPCRSFVIFGECNPSESVGERPRTQGQTQTEGESEQSRAEPTVRGWLECLEWLCVWERQLKGRPENSVNQLLFSSSPRSWEQVSEV
ncbi:hypothetical protein chiPu_0021688 [Chiloscyllium punctatum]|uniref:Uncharacterized protein n=1 Tax=Chiloscyllium punctatum TaxID=137246 RepID=A0A401RKC9_CHIPU|nr:hypothetical protein [Chiloscyllium punctatum]